MSAPGRDRFAEWLDSPNDTSALAGLLDTARQLRDEATGERDAVLALAAEILGAFTTVTGDWHLAGVSREQHDEWRKRAGLPA